MLEVARPLGMKYFKIALISAAMLLVTCASAVADESLPYATVYSDPGSIGSDSYDPKTTIFTGDEPATAYYEFGGTALYGKQSPTESIPANSEHYFAPHLSADYAGGQVFYRLIIVTATQTKIGPAQSIYTRGPVPMNLEPPRVEGNPYPGETLTCNPGKWNISTQSMWLKWSGTGDFRSNEPISNLDSLKTITLSEDDIGKTIRCEVRASTPHVGEATAFSSYVKVVARPESGTVGQSSAPCKPGKLAGLKLATARDHLHRNACRISRISHTWSSRVGKGRVISAKRVGDRSVSLVISKGKKPRKR